MEDDSFDVHRLQDPMPSVITSYGPSHRRISSTKQCPTQRPVQASLEWDLDTNRQESQIQSKAQEKDIKEALLQQLQQRCRDSRSPRSCRFQHKPWAFLSACVEPPRNKSTPRTEDMQAMWSSTGPCVQDRRDHTLQSGSQQDQVSAQNSHPRVQSMPRGIRKRIIGELKKQIHHLEQQKSETKMSNQEDPQESRNQ